MVGELNSVFLPEDSKTLRQPILPEIPRSDQFMAEFDQRGIFYSVFRDISGRRVWFLGPELLSLKDEILPIWVVGGQSKKRTKIRLIKNEHALVGFADLPEVDDKVHVDIGADTLSVGVGGNHSVAFKDSRIVYCISKENDLRWISDWAHFYVKEHAADTFVIFDNNSSAYSTQDIEMALNKVPGVKKAIAIDWPFIYGAHDPVAQKLGKPYHFLFAQPVAHMELFLRYGIQSKSILNVDIDELVVSTKRESIFDVVEQRVFGCIKFDRFLVENVRERDDGHESSSFCGFHFRDKERLGRQNPWKKWAIAPSKLKLTQPVPMLWTHRVYGAINPYPASKEFKCYHFAGITTNWRENDDLEIEREWQHTRHQEVQFDERAHVKDQFLATVLDGIFERPITEQDVKSETVPCD